MTWGERRVVGGLALIYGLRMLGFYMVLPVLSLHADGLRGSSDLLIGLCLGVYGLSQALLQVPSGIWADRHGRRRVIVSGLMIFAIGSAVAALAQSAWMLLIGRLLQGAGAISSAVVALIADFTRAQVRAQAMAMLGVAVGLAFAAGLMFGPDLADRFGVPSLFWLTAILSVVGAFYVAVFVPRPRKEAHHEELEWTPGQARTLLHDTAFLRLDLSVFILHAAVTAYFVVLPGVLESMVPAAEHGRIYRPIMAAGIALLIGSAILAERKGKLREAIVVGALLLGASTACLLLGNGSLPSIVAAIALAVAAVAVAEPAMPAMLTRLAAQRTRGTAAGLFHMCQFLGSFAGGLLAGALKQHPQALAWVLFGSAAAWLLMSWRLPRLASAAALPQTAEGA